jgi:hypothetical protein
MQAAPWPKPVLFTARLGPNFLWHMLAAARIGYDSEYADRYADSISGRHLELLRRNAARLTFGGGEMGDLAQIVTMFPAWLHLESRSDFERYFLTLDRCLQEGSFRAFSEAFPAADWTDRFYVDLPARTFPAADREYRHLVAGVAAVYPESIEAYKSRVWPIARREMAPRILELTEHFAAKDYISAWEDALGLSFQTPTYEIVLCHSNKNGPDYNSLGYGGNLFFYDKPFVRTCQFVSHEIGTHLLTDSMLEVSRGERYAKAGLYGCFEVLAMFWNRKILGVDSLDYDLARYDDVALLDFYEREYWAGITDPTELLRRACERLGGG